MSSNHYPISGDSLLAHFPENGRQYKVQVDRVLIDIDGESDLSSVGYVIVACTDDCRWLAYFSHYEVFDVDHSPAHDGKTYLLNTRAAMCNHIWNNVLDEHGQTDSVGLLVLKRLSALRLRA